MFFRSLLVLSREHNHIKGRQEFSLWTIMEKNAVILMYAAIDASLMHLCCNNIDFHLKFI
jgi:hypothetical protein